MAPISVTKTNAGRSDQNATPKLTSNPGHPPAGSPNQPASATSRVSYSPNQAAAAQPDAIPMTGAQSRQ